MPVPLVCVYQFSKAISHVFYVTSDNHGKGLSGFDRCKRSSDNALQMLKETPCHSRLAKRGLQLMVFWMLSLGAAEGLN